MSNRLSYWPLLFGVFATAALASPARGQWPCRQAVPFPRTGTDVSQHEFDSVLVIAQALTEASWSWIRDWMVANPRPVPGFFVGVGEGIASNVRNAVLADSATARLTAHALAWMMRGESAGFLVGQDVLAASLYRAWSLDPAPALGVVANSLQTPHARLLAVRAVEPHWTGDRFAEAAVAALCTMAARAAGMQAILPDSVRNDAGYLLSEDEGELLGLLEHALLTGRGESDGGREILRSLPPRNPVTEHVARYLSTGSQK